jgi:hypothetical protein
MTRETNDNLFSFSNRRSIQRKCKFNLGVSVHLQVKYVGNGEEQNGLQMMGLNLMGKTLAVRGARVAYSIWDVAGNSRTTDGKYNLFSSLASSLMGFFFWPV